MKQRYKRQNRGVQLLWLPLIAALTLGTVSMAAAETTLERIRASGKVKVGIANINPYGYVDGEGRVTGQSAELLRAFFAEQNVEVTPVVTEFGALIGGLRAGHFDIVSTGMLIQHDRCGVVAFGNPEYRSDNAFAVKQGNPLGLTSYQSVMESPVARFGMISGSGEIALAANAFRQIVLMLLLPQQSQLTMPLPVPPIRRLNTQASPNNPKPSLARPQPAMVQWRFVRMTRICAKHGIAGSRKIWPTEPSPKLQNLLVSALKLSLRPV